ncbi:MULTISPECIES: hypothetical protein [unclassified Flavobacterium]|uniref:hypothetical protein n=1 Tax=unclassified Flavobacterium TaxID=196869 RepID=UPI001F12B5AF|nr:MULTISPECIES: hypothetical protein [unclassified Flavobacterium]UMY66244.1 hypothetical protein MKO97_02370 [Flavobacterium sp. HJ-32-4]
MTMMDQIRKSRATKVIACYLVLMLVVETLAPTAAYALTEGPSQPEFNSFTPIGTSDMVNLSSGDLNYNIPIMDVGGYPINLAYQSGVTMDQEASWVGLGWNLNIGQINREVRGLPDDFKGDKVVNQNKVRPNVTIGVTSYVNPSFIAFGDGDSMGLKYGGGLDIQYNNYTGISVVPSLGATFQIGENVSVGMSLTASSETGASITPSISAKLTKTVKDNDCNESSFVGTLSPSLTYNSRRGLESFNLSSSLAVTTQMQKTRSEGTKDFTVSSSGMGTMSFNPVSFSPTKRPGMKNTSARFTFSFGPNASGLSTEFSLGGYGTIQKLAENERHIAAYGYENSESANADDLMDFNREKERSEITSNTRVLSPSVYTHDLYSIQSQVGGGMFRPYRSQVGFVYDPGVSDGSGSASFGAELEVLTAAHYGYNARVTKSKTKTGVWNTTATPFFKEKTASASRDYEPVYFARVGECKPDPGYNSLSQTLQGNKAITLKFERLNKSAVNAYQSKDSTSNPLVSNLGAAVPFLAPIRRTTRQQRNTVIQKVTKAEAIAYGLSPFINYNTSVRKRFGSNVFKPLAPGHHTAGYIVTDENGSRSIYGETVYNKEKREVTFNVGNRPSAVSNATGLVKYETQDTSLDNSNGIDNYFSRVITPGYAHTYLLSSVLSPDYSDITGNGPSDDDLGSYTKFVYKNYGDYQWRVPFGVVKPDNADVSSNGYGASYNEGLKSNKRDQKGSYLYGVKENKYLKMIVTKTHVAFFDLSERYDGFGTMNEYGGGTPLAPANNRTYHLDQIRLYSKADALRLMDNNPANDAGIQPIKTAHFKYDYSLCGHVDNNLAPQSAEGNANKGKLTLRQVYFTYRNSQMGKYTPYKFDYSPHNPDYNAKAYDIWGNYKPFEAGSWLDSSSKTTPQEFPYVDQQDSQLDAYAESWSLKTITLPSGGKISVSYEADDYQYVQDKPAMQMFKVDGVTDDIGRYVSGSSTSLYTSSGHKKYIVVKLPPQVGLTPNQVVERYTKGLDKENVYFNFLVNMTDSDYDYVSGYFKMENNKNGLHPEYQSSSGLLFIPMKMIDKEGGNGTGDSSPISVAGCFFGRQYLNTQINGLPDPDGSIPNIADMAKNLVKQMDFFSELWNGANGRLLKRGIARNFKPKKSWIRLWDASGHKKGGGSRVKQVLLYDEWNSMLENPASTNLDRYNKSYGQNYAYTLADAQGTSSGVATYEPNACKENPLIVPLEEKAQRLAAKTYAEKPFGESYFPASTVTYSRVVVTNEAADGNSKSGSVVSEFYTSKDFPTLSDYTNLAKSSKYHSDTGNLQNALASSFSSLFGLTVFTNDYLVGTQGFVVQTNDMNGKDKKKSVLDAGGKLISSVEYRYSTNATDNRLLNNKIPTIDATGAVSTDNEVATSMDVVNDFNESFAQTESYGLSANVDLLNYGIPIIVGIALPESAVHKQILRTAVTTKVIHRCGILTETIATDLGSRVSTRNVAWDANTGKVLLTQTVNEFDDSYYTFDFPAYWHYKEMGMASKNIDIKGEFVNQPEGSNMFYSATINGFATTSGIDQYLRPGDEILIGQPQLRVWVGGYNTSKTAVFLIDAMGQRINSLLQNASYNRRFRVLRSGFKNQQMASMASITLMANPVATSSIVNRFKKTAAFDPRVINASAIEYTDIWQSQCENGLPSPGQTDINAFLYNTRNIWRPSKSYAYLTGRNRNLNDNTRKSGFFSAFSPFYYFDDGWKKDLSGWEFASEVTLVNPYGPEIENRDALGRYSSAQYGYGYQLPMAISANARYQEMGYDGFEDYNPLYFAKPNPKRSHFGFQNEVNNEDGTITDEAAHTGKRSLRVPQGHAISVSRDLIPCAQGQ